MYICAFWFVFVIRPAKALFIVKCSLRISSRLKAWIELCSWLNGSEPVEYNFDPGSTVKPRNYFPNARVSKRFLSNGREAITQQFDGRTSYVMWSFRDMLHSTNSKTFS